jgi:fibronectin-binding autotransporter adhesin
MAITGQQIINIGLPNESANSDSLYTAFTKANVNFQTLFACASPYNTFTAGAGVNVVASNNIVTVTNTGVLNILAGTGVTISGANGNVTISANAGGGNGGGTVTSVGVNPVSNTRLTVTGSPVVSAGNINIDLATTGITAGSYANPNVTVDAYGRVTTIANGSIAGTVTSVGLTPGSGIQISGGPITSNGNITVTNTGVTRVNAGAGIALSSGNGNVTISATSLGGTVTSVGVNSSTLSVSGSPIVNSGTITVNIPTTTTLTFGNVATGNITATGDVTVANVSANTSITSAGYAVLSGSEDLANGAAVSLVKTISYFSTAAAETATMAAGSAGLIKTFMMVADGGDMVITVTDPGWKIGATGTMTFDSVGDACTMQYIANKWFCIGNNGVVFA